MVNSEQSAIENFPMEPLLDKSDSSTKSSDDHSNAEAVLLPDIKEINKDDDIGDTNMELDGSDEGHDTPDTPDTPNAPNAPDSFSPLNTPEVPLKNRRHETAAFKNSIRKSEIENATREFIAQVIRTVDSLPANNEFTIEGGEEDTSINVTKTIKQADTLLQEGSSIAEVDKLFQESVKEFDFWLRRPARTLYSSLSNSVEAYLAEWALAKVLILFEDFDEKDVSLAFFKPKYKIRDKEQYLPPTAAEILELYKKAKYAIQSVTWQYALAETQRLLIDIYCPPPRILYSSPWLSKKEKELYSKALDILQLEYHFKYVVYNDPTLLTKLSPEKFDAFLSLIENDKIPESAQWKEEVDADIDAVKDFFKNLKIADYKELTTLQFNALDHLAFCLFDYANKIPRAEHSKSQLYSSLLLTIAKYQRYDLKELKEENKVEILEAVAAKMNKELHYYRIMSEKFKEEMKSHVAPALSRPGVT